MQTNYEAQHAEDRLHRIRSCIKHGGAGEFHRWSVLFRRHIATDGVFDLAEMAGCYWLLDAIASYHSRCAKHPLLKDFQVWTLKIVLPTRRAPRRRAELICTDGNSDKAIITQRIPLTDFPLDEGVAIWVERGADDDGNVLWTLMFPCER